MVPLQHALGFAGPPGMAGVDPLEAERARLRAEVQQEAAQSQAAADAAAQKAKVIAAWTAHRSEEGQVL